MKKSIFIIMVLLLGLGVFYSMNINKEMNNSLLTSNKKYVVAVSIIPQSAFVKAVAGDFADIVTMIPPGKSPENYQPTPNLMKDLSKADIYFSIGVPTEETYILPKVLDLNPSIKIIDMDDKVNKELPPRYFEDGMHQHDSRSDSEHSYDPHIWLSPKRVQYMVKIIAEELSKTDPVNSETYRKNAEHYIQELQILDKEIGEILHLAKGKSFIVFHPVLGYFADDYGLKMVCIEKEGKEAAPRRLQSIIDYAKSNNIKVIFYQAEIDSKQVDVIANEIDGLVKMIDPLSYNYIENTRKIAITLEEAFN